MTSLLPWRVGRVDQKQAHSASARLPPPRGCERSSYWLRRGASTSVYTQHERTLGDTPQPPLDPVLALLDRQPGEPRLQNTSPRYTTGITLGSALFQDLDEFVGTSARRTPCGYYARPERDLPLMMSAEMTCLLHGAAMALFSVACLPRLRLTISTGSWPSTSKGRTPFPHATPQDAEELCLARRPVDGFQSNDDADSSRPALATCCAERRVLPPSFAQDAALSPRGPPRLIIRAVIRTRPGPPLHRAAVTSGRAAGELLLACRQQSVRGVCAEAK